MYPTAVAEASNHQVFVDGLDNYVIEPLIAFKVSQKHLFWANILRYKAIRKDSKAGIRVLVEEGLKESAAKYAHYAENTISKLQQAYLKKYHPR